MEQPKDYANFDTNDFINDDRFLQWVKFPDAARDLFWEHWLNAHPHKKQQAEEARAFILRMDFAADTPSPAAIQASLEANLLRIAALEQQQAEPEKQGRVRSIWWWAAAAVITGCIAIAGVRLWWKQPVMVHYTGLTDGVRKVWLPDSSVVILNANATVSFKDNWSEVSAREVWLEGEAFFDVKPLPGGKQAARAFAVHSGKMKIDVLGTSFNVKGGQAFTNVSLNTGKIKIHFDELPETPIYLAPGDFVQYSAKNNKIIKKQVNAELYAVWREEGRQLKNVTLKEMGVFIQDTYGYKVKISSPELAQQQLSGGLRVKDEASLLETLSFALGLEIIKQEDTLFIQSGKQ